MSADGNGRVDSRISIFVSLDKQLTEREWRRPLTWLDRFRDAVLLPASWGDENIQPHVGNKYLQFAFCKKKKKNKTTCFAFRGLKDENGFCYRELTKGSVILEQSQCQSFISTRCCSISWRKYSCNSSPIPQSHRSGLIKRIIATQISNSLTFSPWIYPYI